MQKVRLAGVVAGAILGLLALGESYVCVSKAEFDRNNVGEQWVDKDGVKKR